MYEITGKNGSWEIQRGTVGLYPAKENGKPVQDLVRLAGKLPPDCGWSPGDRGMLVPMAGRAPGQGMLYIYPEDHASRWVRNGKGRSVDDLATFKVQARGPLKFDIYLPALHSVVRAIRRAVKREHIGLTATEFHVNVNGDSMVVRVPMRKDLKAYVPRNMLPPGRGDLFGWTETTTCGEEKR